VKAMPFFPFLAKLSEISFLWFIKLKLEGFLPAIEGSWLVLKFVSPAGAPCEYLVIYDICWLGDISPSTLMFLFDLSEILLLREICYLKGFLES
jgi:hypothetical protein